MPLFFNSLAVLLLLMGGLAPSIAHAIPAQSLALTLIALAVLMGVGLGFWWFRCLRQTSSATPLPKDPNDLIDEFLNKNLLWLQGLRPKKESLLLTKERATSLMRVICDRFMIALLFFLDLPLIFLFIIILTDPRATSGFFGSLLRISFGKSIALAICLYLIISITSIYSLGVFAKLGGDVK